MTEDSTEQRHTRGTEVYARLTGSAPTEVRDLMAARVGGTVADESLIAAGGPGWFAPGLTPRERALTAFTALVCLGVGSDRLDSHVDACREAGIGEEETYAALVLLAHYIGYPLTSTAAEAAHRRWAD